MALLDKIIHKLDSQLAKIPFSQDDLQDVKGNIQVLLNSKLDDCLTANDFGLLDVIESNINTSDLCLKMANEINFLIGKYERRIRILSIRYDDSLTPWRLSFFLRCNFFNDSFREFNLEIVFKNDRHCEVV